MPKRLRVTVNDDNNTDRLMDELIELLRSNRDELELLLGYIANEAKISTASFKKARIDLPSFSVTKWSDLAPQFGLRSNIGDLSEFSLETFTTPKYYLSPSFHEVMFENAWRWQDVFREKVDQTREEAGVRIFDPYIVPIVALFQGRVIDKPKQAMFETKYSTAGDVDHRISMIDRTLFLIIEFERGTPDTNALAQLFLELLSAAEADKSNDISSRVYGLVTNLVLFKFYSYDPSTNKFCFDETIVVDTKRMNVLADMMNVSNKIFGVILSAYMEGLHATSQDRVKHNNTLSLWQQTGQNTTTSSSKLSELTTVKGKKTDSCNQWETALTLAQNCCDKFEEPVASYQDIEERANKALGLLTQSVRSIPRTSPFSGGDDDPSTSVELKALATRVVKETYEKLTKA